MLNSQTGQELWKSATGPIKWEDWEVKQLIPTRDGGTLVEDVDLRAVVTRRRIRDVAVTGAILSLLTWYAPSFWPSINRATFSYY